MENYFRNSGMFDLICRWKLHLSIIAVVAGGLGIVFSSSHFITPKYKSYAVLYPANLNPMSEESETEQMLEVLNSQDIKFRIYDAFNLSAHYGISKDDPYFLTKLNKQFEGSVSFSKTENEAVELSVMDQDPQTASDIADSIIVFYNQKALNLSRNKSGELAIAFGEHLQRKQIEIDSLAEILNKYRKENNMLDYKVQTKEYTRAIANGKTFSESRETMNNWRNYGGEFIETDSLFWYAMCDYHMIKQEQEQFVRDSSKNISYAHVVSSPFPSDKKAYPTRWVFVFFSMLGSLFAGIFVLIFIDKAKLSRNKSE